MKETLVYILVFFFLTGCASPKKRIQKSTKNILSSKSFQNQFTGFLVIDPKTKDTLLNIHGEKYFTPASNTKIFTLFTALKLLPDSIPALKYTVQKDTLYIEGTGDPTLLHTYFNSQKTIGFLKQHRHIALYLNNFTMKKYGPGWAWEDYQYYYQPERNGFPLFGNVVTINDLDSIAVIPSYFKSKVISLDYSKNRELGANTFYFPPSRKDTVEIPFKTDSTLTRTLLEGVLGKKIRVVQKMPESEKKIRYSVPSDSVYKRMMHESDNFLAEQLLILASSTLSDTLDGSIAQDHILKNELADLRQSPRWVDGSGLSRYNLFTPESIVHVLYSMYLDVSRKRLFELFPAGGASDEFTSETPYMYAKTGSLGNNYCLSGYLQTKSGKTLIFSFMNNHFRQPSSEVKRRMQLIFERIRDEY
ncbi:D-alanyl-D-alanine carboxypeptidase [hydrothermal vent metagenome]|uniref:D-alanyl-D-alanine carboxypeptidase n=1 Tax=hydrothermal vent metagenome TaxID=652676 RepID=A0A3B0U0K4_9ZZZZ